MIKESSLHPICDQEPHEGIDPLFCFSELPGRQNIGLEQLQDNKHFWKFAVVCFVVFVLGIVLVIWF